ncbi:uncharacterized protein IL334_001264 [Kwoniella shivajii]|uniref:Uncharacterized protein n=1 Tax=Kwoniella shivajii TaxID=564305 RepID=A0ABZ1CVN1_9TREE|nr:hypothetical protein IL334_001264 [Kwoniella shivajii]
MPIATSKSRDRHIPISPPLPLPVHFGLLPTLSPGKTLCPLFYVLIDNIPIYLTLDPSHKPHISLIPLFLTLNPLSPLSILSTLHIQPSDYSLSLEGIAPHIDIWVPIVLARKICGNLGKGVERLFWDENDPKKGLLGRIIGEVESWDDGLAVGHNWLPPSSQIPKSSYSLSSLSSTPLKGIDIIQDNRYITTPLDDDTRNRIIRNGQDKNPSKIREGIWKDSWNGIIALSDKAWKEFLLYPSIPLFPPNTPPGPSSLPQSSQSNIVHDILPLIPLLIYQESSPPTYPFTLSDLSVLFDASPLLARDTSILSTLTSLTTSKKSRERALTLQEKQYKARLGICLAETIGGIMVSTWQASLGRKHHHHPSKGDTKGVLVFIEKVDFPDEEITTVKNGLNKKRTHWEDTMEDLESRRGSSPPRQQVHFQYKPKPGNLPKTRQISSSIDNDSDLHTRLGEQGDEPNPVMVDVPQIYQDTPPGPPYVTNWKHNEDGTERVMLSEKFEGWGHYKAFSIAIFVGLVLGYFQVF